MTTAEKLVGKPACRTNRRLMRTRHPAFRISPILIGAAGASISIRLQPGKGAGLVVEGQDTPKGTERSVEPVVHREGLTQYQ